MPGTVYPTLGPRPTTSRGEVALHELFTAMLPAGWYAWHSLPLRVGASEYVGEADYVIAAPNRGVLTLEVKSGHLWVDDGVWHQGDHVLKKPPLAQATAFAHNLSDEIAKAGGGRVPFGAACCFPDMTSTDGLYSGNLRGAVLGAVELARLDVTLPELFDRVVRAAPVPQFAGWKKILDALWGAAWVPHVRIVDQMAEAERRVVRLDKEQLKMLDAVGKNARVCVEGEAGTGKTVVARALGERRARDRKKVLYFCFTDALALAVDAHFAKLRDDGLVVRAAPVRKHAAAMLKGAGVAEPRAGDQKYWDEISLHAAMDALPADGERPDFVIVDEAQDLADTDWLLVEALARGGGLWTFGDARQRFWGDRKMPEALANGMVSYTLGAQHRSPGAIAALAAKYAPTDSQRGAAATGVDALGSIDDADDDEGGPSSARSGAEPVRIVACAKGHIEIRVEREVSKLLAQGVKPGDIAILSLAGQTHARTMGMKMVAEQVVARADEKGAEGKIVADTCLRFKGLERAFVVIVDLPGDCAREMKQADVRMHIALTRATVGVIVVGTKEAVGGDGRLVSAANSQGP